MEAIRNTLFQNHRKGTTRPYEYRISQLQAVKNFLLKEENVLNEALKKDLHRSDFESRGLEILATILEIDYIMNHLKEWMKPEQTPVPALFAPAISEIHPEPFGVCLIIAPFNYPVVLTIQPLVAAIAAGNSAVLKPSELTPATEKVMMELLPKYIDGNHYRVVTGDYKISQELLALRWDKVFYTGSTTVGKIVYEAAAKNLTPVSLELGGKSPTIVDESVTDLELVAQRILWGKTVNAGQTCIAPDYVYVHEKHYDQFLQLLKQKSQQFYGNDAQSSKDYARIVNQRHFQRLKALLDDSKDVIYCGGKTDAKDNYIEPTVLANPKKNAKIMQEEIFGPLLPVFKFSRLEEVIDHVQEGEKPLTLYIFARSSETTERLIREIQSGSVLVNDTLFQFANIHAPFGGVGHSGLGAYHGKYSFDCFSQKRAVLRRDDHRLLDVPVRYPPYTDFGLKFFRFGANLPDIPPITTTLLVKVAVVVGVIAYFVKQQL